MRFPARAPTAGCVFGVRDLVMLQISSAREQLTMSVMTKSTRPISTRAFRYRSSVASVNSFAMTAAIVYCGAFNDHETCGLLPITMVTAIVSPSARPKPSMMAPVIPVRAKNSDGADGLPARGSKRVRRLALRNRHRLQHLARNSRRERHNHHRQDERRGEHADTERRTAEERQCLQGRSACANCNWRTSGHEHEDAPQAVDDRRNGGQQFGEERQRLAQPVGASSDRKIAMPSATGVEMIRARIDE